MTRKDYELMAGAFASSIDHYRAYPDNVLEREVRGVQFAAEVLAGKLAADNPRFDRDRFLRAAGVAR